MMLRFLKKKNLVAGNQITNNRVYDHFSYQTADGKIGGGQSDPRMENDSLEYLQYNHNVQSDFAEDYDSQNQTARTWYEFRSIQPETIISDGRPEEEDASKIEIQHASDVYYNRISNEVVAKARYSGIAEKYGKYYFNYSYGAYTIQLCKKDSGGNLRIDKGDFHW